ncbi:MAG TPA: hypothetical protein VK550_06350 [Polyangiaceae bacterium]|nr:hypothetical protein [Polyangiaceae bacterium]
MGMGRISASAAIGLTLACMLRVASAEVHLTTVDAWGKGVDAGRSHASIERTPPERTAEDPTPGVPGDPDAIRFVLSGPRAEVPAAVRIASRDTKDAEVDRLDVTLVDSACPAGLGPVCRVTPLLRVVADDIDRNHPLVKDRSVRADIGGVLSVSEAGRSFGSIRVGGPRMTPVGPIARLRGKVRIVIVRHRPKGAPPFGTDDEGAKVLALRQLGLANALWGQCGINFGEESEADIRLVDPPPTYLLALGCDVGLPSSGGEIRVRVDGRDVRAELKPRMTPRAAARVVARSIEQAGFVARVSENARIEPGADRTTDVLVRRRDGQFVSIERPLDGRISTDATMTACIGGVDLSDGLDHFVDVDAPAGTVEERALVKAFDDGDPSTIKVFMIPAFAGGGRIGESFIFADRSSVRNVVIEDRAGVRADRASFALAHELGHILLDMPGHPDDYGVDLPTLLMDSDAADPSAFGPRRITIGECARAFRQSGPRAAVPLLTVWPLPAPP